jgi:soluble lytic murein transglycosylase
MLAATVAVVAALAPLARAASPAPATLSAADVAPVLASGKEARGLAAFEAGRMEEAAALLAGSALPEASLVRARALAAAGRPVEAARALAGLDARLPALADRIAFLRGEALLAAGRPRDAEDAFAAVPEGSLLAADARLARAGAAASRGARDAALATLEPLLGRPAPPDLSRPDPAASALLLAGRLEAERGRPAAARAALLACWSAHALAPEAPECLSRLRGLPGEHGAAPALADRVRRAESLLDLNRNDVAITLLEPAARALPGPAPGEPLSCRVRGALGRAHRKERAYGRAIEILRPVVERCDDPAVRLRALWFLAGATSASGERAAAADLYRRIAREHPGTTLADDALFFAAELAARDGRYDDARAALAEVISHQPAGDYLREARFRLAWLERKEGDLDAAIARFLDIEEAERDQDGYEHARAAYWRARLLSARGEEGARAARAVLSDLVRRYPADYYGLLARARIADLSGEGGPPVVLPEPMALPAEAGEERWPLGPLASDPHLRAGVALLRAGLGRDAAGELAAVELPAGDPGAVLLVADLLDRAGDHRTAHHLLRTRARAALRRAPEPANLRAWRIAYPPAFRAVVARHAPAAGIDPELLQALMREESALDPLAVSPAGAIGLTQLMLPTAREVARRLKVARPSKRDLMRPEVNIRLGARYLGDLVRRYDGEAALALAAYNAGGGAVSRWLVQRGELELDEFVEEIPLEETRGYVKRVLRSYAAYRLLYGAEGQGLPPGGPGGTMTGRAGRGAPP